MAVGSGHDCVDHASGAHPAYEETRIEPPNMFIPLSVSSLKTSNGRGHLRKKLEVKTVFFITFCRVFSLKNSESRVDSGRGLAVPGGAFRVFPGLSEFSQRHGAWTRTRCVHFYGWGVGALAPHLRAFAPRSAPTPASCVHLSTSHSLAVHPSCASGPGILLHDTTDLIVGRLHHQPHDF